MASYLDKFKVSTALDNSVTMDLSCQHITTADWMNGAPTYIKECVPGEKLRVNVQTFARLAPMAVPSFGRGVIHNRAFFVPMRTVFTNWNEFITNTNDSIPVVGASSASTTAVNPSTVPLIKNSDLVRLFIEPNATAFTHAGSDLAQPVTGASASSRADICVDVVNSSAENPSHTALYYKLSNRGRRVMKVLQSLGYNIIWSFGHTALAVTRNAVDDTYSALPLLSWLKICLDWYYPSAYVGDDMYRYIDSIIKAHSDGSGAHNFSYDELAYIFVSALTLSGDSPWSGLMCYDSDYFTSAFDNPLGTPGGNYVASSAPIKDINFIDGTSVANNPIVYDAAAGETGTTAANLDGSVMYRPATIANSYGARITQYGLDALKALTDYVKRHQLVGARALDRYYARFGKSLASDKLDRSNYLGCQNVPMQIGDVMSHTDSNGAVLGDYAGKGLAYGNDGNFEFSTDEYGYFVIVSSIIPTVGYYQGMDRQVLHKGRLDFWTPEFDQLGNQAIAKKELYVPMNVIEENNAQQQELYINANLRDGIFGYAPRYAEYKTGRDRVTGDFRYHSYNVGDTSDSWHLMRKIDGLFQDSDQIAHSKYFVLGTDRTQYNRIFNNTLTTADKFYLVHDFKVQSTAPMHSLYDSYEFKDEDESKKVVADVNGVKVN